jgi:5-methylcytosine-specific restriction enzyme B
MVIEEINRGQTAHIFGELLTLLESSKRQPQDALSLTYAKAQEKVYIPDNVYLVATMNRADRSLMPLDFALKRRFAFATLTPKFNQAWVEHGLKHGLSLALLEMIQEKIQQLNQEIAENRYLGQGLVLGHSYFTPRQKIYDEKNWYQDVIESEVLPLLEDYCADDAMQLDKWQTDLLDLQ